MIRKPLREKDVWNALWKSKAHTNVLQTLLRKERRSCLKVTVSIEVPSWTLAVYHICALHTAQCTSYIHIFLCVDTEIKKTNIIWGAISRVINFFWLGDNKITLMTWLLCKFENTWNTYCQYQLLPRPVRKKPWLILIYCIRIWEWAFISRESKKCVSPLWKGSCSYCQHFFDITHLFHLFPSLLLCTRALGTMFYSKSNFGNLDATVCSQC